MLLSILLQAGGAGRITQAAQEGVSTIRNLVSIIYTGIMLLAFLGAVVSIVMMITGEKGEDKTKKAGSIGFTLLAIAVLLLVASRLFGVDIAL